MQMLKTNQIFLTPCIKICIDFGTSIGSYLTWLTLHVSDCAESTYSFRVKLYNINCMDFSSGMPVQTSYIHYYIQLDSYRLPNVLAMN